jgi:hypothetical protein
MEHRLRVCKNRVLREIYGPKMEEEGGHWRKLHNEEFLLWFVLLTKCYMGNKITRQAM